jgi:hypothetical protein
MFDVDGYLFRDLLPGLWIRIRMDPQEYELLGPDPDPGGQK